MDKNVSKEEEEKGGWGERISEMVLGASGAKANDALNTKRRGPGSQRQ